MGERRDVVEKFEQDLRLGLRYPTRYLRTKEGIRRDTECRRVSVEINRTLRDLLFGSKKCSKVLFQ